MQAVLLRSISMRTFQVGMKQRILYAVLLLSGFAFADPAVDAATSRLSHVGVFAFGGVGFAGSISQGQRISPSSSLNRRRLPRRHSGAYSTPGPPKPGVMPRSV